MSENRETLVDLEIEADGWLSVLPDARAVVETGIGAALAAAGFAGSADIAVLLCDDAEMRKLNKTYRHKDRPTNVLSFPAPGSMRITGVFDHLGDIAMGLETCLAEAADQGKSLKNHVLHLSVHGALHLLGYDHEDDAGARTMEALERDILRGLGVADPYAESHG